MRTERKGKTQMTFSEVRRELEGRAESAPAPTVGPSSAELSALKIALKKSGERATGLPRQGSVLYVNEDEQAAYVFDLKDKRPFLVSRPFVDAGAFDRLRRGTRVAFYPNKYNAVAALVILAGT
jgi:hypothetical protein